MYTYTFALYLHLCPLTSAFDLCPLT
jgi:hypothetical protein